MSGNRMVLNFELSDKLKNMERMGVNVPTLGLSNNMPTYSHTTEEGVEVYNMVGRSVEVPAGSVIDSYGNVVNLGKLQSDFGKKLSEKIFEEQTQEVRHHYINDIDTTIKKDDSFTQYFQKKSETIEKDFLPYIVK